MYLMVRATDNIIVGSAARPIDEKIASKKGFKVYQIPDEEFKPEMIGARLETFSSARK